MSFEGSPAYSVHNQMKMMMLLVRTGLSKAISSDGAGVVTNIWVVLRALACKPFSGVLWVYLSIYILVPHLKLSSPKCSHKWTGKFDY